MNGIVLFDDDGLDDLQPLTCWRSVCELRLGRKIILDRSAQRLERAVRGIWTHDRLARVTAQRCHAPANAAVEAGDVLVNSRWLPDPHTHFPAAPHVGMIADEVAFVCVDNNLAQKIRPEDLARATARQEVLATIDRAEANGSMIRHPWDIVLQVGTFLAEDWEPGDACLESDLDKRVTLSDADRVHVGARTRIHPSAVLDATDGPIFISHDVSVEPFVVIQGPAYIGPGCRVNPHSYLHGGVAVGPMCKVGGEIDGSVLDGYTNKQHAGFLGHAYVGRWVNIGAGSENSDLKNTYNTVKVPVGGRERDTGSLFFGAVIGDHAKLGINTTLATGAVIGFAAMIATSHVVPKYVPPFGWLTDEGLSRGKPDLLLDAATRMMARRKVDMTDEEIELFLELGEQLAADIPE